jgi:hypothetical protein
MMFGVIGLGGHAGGLCIGHPVQCLGIDDDVEVPAFWFGSPVWQRLRRRAQFIRDAARAGHY